MRAFILILMAAAGSPAAAQSPSPAPSPSPAAAPSQGDERETLYAIGVSMWQGAERMQLTPEETAHVVRGFNEAAAGKATIDANAFRQRIGQFTRARAMKQVAEEKAASEAYVNEAAKAPGAVKLESGLVFTELQAGAGPAPTADDVVTVHYRGTLRDGTEFDSSIKRGQPADFPLRGVVRCWTEGLQKMKVGGKARLVCPSSLAYGDRGRPGIPGGAALTFEVELVGTKARPAPAPTAAEPAASPKP